MNKDSKMKIYGWIIHTVFSKKKEQWFGLRRRVEQLQMKARDHAQGVEGTGGVKRGGKMACCTQKSVNILL